MGLVLKTFLKKAWAWLKHNWYAPVVVVYTLILWFIFRRKDSAHEVLEVRSKSYKEQIDVINEAHEKEIKKRDEVLKKYSETIAELESDFAKNNKELDSKKKKAVKEIVDKYHDNPDALAKLMSTEFNFEYTNAPNGAEE